MRRPSATLAAAALSAAVYVGVAAVAGRIDVPTGVPTASMPWISPFRVVATVGFAIASVVGVPHLAGDFLAAVLLGGVLGAIFSLSRRLIGG